MVNQPTSLDCPSCGAPLQITSNESRVVCQYCHATIALPQSDTQKAIVIEWGELNLPRPKPRKIFRAVIALMVIFLLVVGVVVALAINSINGVLPEEGPRIYGISNEVLLPLSNAEDQGRIVAITTNSDETYRLTLFDFNEDTGLKWQSTDLKAPGYEVDIKVQDETVILAIKDSLVAFRLSDGQELWRTSLSDQLPGNCPSCLQVVNEKIFVLTQIGGLHAFDLTTGKQSWLNRMDAFDNAIYIMDGDPIVIQEENEEVSITRFDAQVGDVIAQIYPTCSNRIFTDDDQEFGLHDFLMEDGAGENFFIMFGFWDPGCLEKWHGFDMKRQWQALIPEDLVRSQPQLLTSETTLFISKTKGNLIWKVEEASGEASEFLTTEDYEITPLFFQDEILVIEAIRLKGTPRYELWAFDTGNGKQLWQVIPSAKKSIEDTPSSIVNQDGVYALHQEGNTLILMQAFEEGQLISFDHIDLLTGVIGTTVEMNLPEQIIFTLQLIGWQGSTVWIESDGLKAIDSQNANIMYRFKQ